MVDTAVRDHFQSPVLSRIRILASRFFIGFLWFYAVLNVAVGAAVGNDLLFLGLAGFVFALVPTLFWFQDGEGMRTRTVVAAGMSLQWALLIYATSGAPDGFILDAHMVYFIINAQLLAYFCWRSVVVATLIPAVHHLVLTFGWPLLVWPSADYEFLHLTNHVVFVVMISGSTLWLSWRLENLFNESFQALTGMAAARQEAEQVTRQQQAHQEASTAERRRVLDDLARTFESGFKGATESVAAAATQMKESASVLDTAAADATQRSAVVADAAAEAASNVQTVAAAAEELSASIAEIGRRVTHSASIAGRAAEEATRTQAVVRSLNDGAQKIGDVVRMINGIAGQTNLLALNATIEAARAGEAGKGFAVVASEVKNLAGQAAKATEDIDGQVASIQGATAQVVAAIEGIARTIVEIHEVSTAIAAAVEQQSAATREIARNTQQAAVGTGEVTRNIAGVQEAAAGAGTAANQVTDASSRLMGLAEELRRQMEGFLRGVRVS